MKNGHNFLYQPRDYRTIELWKDVSEEEWYNPLWQRKNSIRDVEKLKKVIRLSPFQESEINRTLVALRAQGKEPMRITPYYASLMEQDPFHPAMLPGEKNQKREGSNGG